MLLEALLWCILGPLFWISDKILWVVRRLPFYGKRLQHVENRFLQTPPRP